MGRILLDAEQPADRRCHRLQARLIGAEMFLSKYMTLHDACQIVNERTGSTGRGPIWDALKESKVTAELWRGEKIGWDPVPADWWNDPDNFNWPVSPLGRFPNLPDASMFRVERRIIDVLWPPAASTAAPAKKSEKAMQPLRGKGKPGTITKRITAEMRKMDPIELHDMKLKELAHRFGAAASTCKKARDSALGMTFDK
jgi:hypothetical protein